MPEKKHLRPREATRYSRYRESRLGFIPSMRTNRDDESYLDPETTGASAARCAAPKPPPEPPASGSVRAESKLAPEHGGYGPDGGASPASARTPPPSAPPGTCWPRSSSNWSVPSACPRAFLDSIFDI